MTAPGCDIPDPRTSQILDAVVLGFESGGYDAVHLRSIAREARVSLATIYEIFSSREELCVAAMERWMEERFYGTLPEPAEGASRTERMMAMVHHLLEPFLAQPVMLTVLARVRLGPGGEGLMEQAVEQARDMSRAVSTGPDDRVTASEQLIVYHLLYSLVAHYAAGKIALDEIIPTMQTSVRRLMEGPFDPPSAGQTSWPA